MQPILVAYATTEGQTRKVAEFIAERLRSRGQRVELLDTATPAAEAVGPHYRLAFIGGSVHSGQHQGALRHFVQANLSWLNAIPVAFFSLSLAAAHAEAGGNEDARRAADAFLELTGLRPARVRLVSGALKYTQYDFFKRRVMRTIAAHHGGDVDTAHDREYTEWTDVEAFVDEALAAAGGIAVERVAQAAHGA